MYSFEGEVLHRNYQGYSIHYFMRANDVIALYFKQIFEVTF